MLQESPTSEEKVLEQHMGAQSTPPTDATTSAFNAEDSSMNVPQTSMFHAEEDSHIEVQSEPSPPSVTSR